LSKVLQVMTARGSPHGGEEALAEAIAYRDGVGVIPNARRARKLMEVAARARVPAAMSALGQMILARPRNKDDRRKRT
jgi:TPR repeat protein